MSFKKIVFIVSFVAVLCFAFNFNAPQANAFTADEIRAQIVALMAQISQLQKQLIEVQGGQAVWCHTFDRDLKYGNAGTEVRALQTALTKDGATAWEYKGYDGVFDEMTASSVVGFQQKYKQDILVPWGLEYGTGFVGKTTREKLNELYGCGTTPVQKCTDTDGGDGYYTKGTVKVNGIEMIDVCKDGNTVIEFYCAWDGSNYRQTEHICPNGCVDGACVRETTPSITVTSPNGGEQWVAGNTYDIKWTSTGIDADLPVEITLIDDVQNKEYQIESYLAKIGDGKLTWTYIPAHTFYTDSSSLFTGDKFKIRVYVATQDVTSQYPDESNDYFSIVEAPATTCHTSDLWAWNYCSPSCKCDAGQGDCDTDADCADGLYCAKNVGTQYGQISTMDVCEVKQEQLASITVLSPNGGEEWVIGDTREIKWSSTGIDKVDIGYRKEGSGADFITIDSGISALSGKYSWTVGRVLSVENQQGSFCIVISESPYIAGSVQHEDKSDDYFSIVVATIELKDLGTNCSVASECKSGFCADSVCCENACNTAHYRCDSRGKCTAPTDLTQTDCFNWGSNSCVGYCPTWCAGESMCKECWGSSMRVYSNNSCSGTGDAVYSGSCNQLGGSCKCFYNRYLYE